MGRKALPDDQKRQRVPVRLSPADRDRVEALAQEHGNSAGAEVEQLALDQLAYLEGVSEPTRRLIAEITDEILHIERVTGKSWHKDRATWGAVREMLRNGPIEKNETDSPSDDPVIDALWEKVSEARRSKRTLIDRLAGLGVSVSADSPASRPPPRTGLFGSVLAGYAMNHRVTEQAAIHALPEGEQRDEAQALFDEIKALDKLEGEADQSHSKELNLYWRESDRGRELYRSIAYERAREAETKGRPFLWSHLLKIWK